MPGGTANWTFTGGTNYNDQSGDAAIVINKASSSTAIICPVSVTFTGVAQTPCSVAVTGVGGLNLTPVPLYANNLNAGTASASYTFTGDANHTGSSDSKNFTIGPASSTTVVGCPLSVDYTGAALTPCAAAVSGVGGLSLVGTPIAYTNNVAKGQATAAYTYAGDVNHTGS